MAPEHLSTIASNPQKPVAPLEQDYKSFKRRVLKSLSAQSLEVPSSHAGLLQEIDSVISIPELRAQAGLSLKAIDGVTAQWQEERRHGYRKVGRIGQEFATNLAGFVRVYAGFFDLARQAGGPYSEVAYGTLSLFFMVAVKKSENDDRFVNTMKELQNSFPRVELAGNLYSQASVKDRISQVYRQIIIFGIEATNYFLARPFGRTMKAIISPAQIGIDKVIEELKGSLAEVNAEIGILMHQRVLDISIKSDKLRHQNDEMLRQNQVLLFEVQELKARLMSMEEKAAQEASQEDEERVTSLCRILGGDPQEYRDPKFCRNNLKETFPEALGDSDVRQGWSANYHQMSQELLRSDNTYRAWMEYPDSCLLVLAGSTEPGGRAPQSSSGCWLSPAALHAFDQFQSQEKNTFFYTCQPDYREKSSSSREVISSLICQLLRWKPQTVRHDAKEITSIVDSDAWSSKDGLTAIRCHISLLAKVLCAMPAEEEIIIVFDRLDLCREPTHLLLRALKNLLKQRNKGLRFLIIMERIIDDYVRGECNAVLVAAADSGIFGRMNWDQLSKGY